MIRLAGVAMRFPVPRPLPAVLRRPFERRSVRALEAIDLEVGRGEVLGLLGSNGSGKTTLLKILATILLPSAGEVHVAGFDALRRPREVRRRVGCSIDVEHGFQARLTGRENLEFFAALAGLGRRAVRPRVEEVLEAVALSGQAGVAFQRYSSGTRQRLGLARALLADPAVLLLDEPTRSVDVEAAASFRRLLRDRLVRAEGRTVVLATHSPEEAADCCDRTAVLDAGRLARVGPCR